VTVVGRPVIPLRVGKKTASAVYVAGTGTNRLVFAYKVGSKDSAATVTTGSAIAVDKRSGIFAGNARLPTQIPGGALATPGVQIDTTAPKPVGKLTLPAAGTYARGRIIEFRARFTEAMYVVGNPHLSIQLGSISRTADYVSGSGTNELVFRYLVVAGDATPTNKGVAVASVISGGIITDAAANASSRKISVPSTSKIRVDGGPLSPPSAQASLGSLQSESRRMARSNRTPWDS